MKNLFLCLTVSAFALASSVLADNATTTKCTKDSACKKMACCATSKSSKTCCSDKASCSSKEKSDCCSSSKSACHKGMPSRTALLSPKASAEAGK